MVQNPDVKQGELFPQAPKPEQELKPESIASFGRYKGKPLQEIAESNINWLTWYLKASRKPISSELRSLIRNQQMRLQ